MEKIMINLTIDDLNNITIVNSKTSKRINIDYSTKVLNAQNVYDIFNYKNDNYYEIKSDIDKIEEKTIKDYYLDIINLFDEIKNELNKLSENNNLNDENNADVMI